MVAFPVTADAAGAATGELVPTVIEVAAIMLGGVAVAELMVRTGAQDAIAAWVERAESGADRTLTLRRRRRDTTQSEGPAPKRPALTLSCWDCAAS